MIIGFIDSKIEAAKVCACLKSCKDGIKDLGF